MRGPRDEEDAADQPSPRRDAQAHPVAAAVAGDLDLRDLERPGRLDGHHPAAGRGFDGLVGELLLRLRHLLLHLLDLLQHLVHVHAHGGYPSSSISRASKVSLKSETKSSSVWAISSSAACVSSPTANETARRRPVTS